MSGCNPSALADIPGVRLHNIPILQDKDVLILDPHGFGQHGVMVKHPVFPVNRDEVFRLHQGKHQLQFLLAAMPRYMKLTAGTIDHTCAQHIQIVHNSGNVALIAWNRICRKQNRISGADLKQSVTGIRQPGQRGHGFTLAAGA
ncbi:hypothetical protein D3C75_649360 [compost metagenome]